MKDMDRAGGLRRSVRRKTAIGFVVFTLFLLLFITVLLGQAFRQSFERAIGPQWEALAPSMGALLNGKDPETLTGAEKAEISGILADFTETQQYRNAPTDAVLCVSEGTSSRALLHAGFGTASFEDTDGQTKYVFFDEYLSTEDMWSLLREALDQWDYLGSRNMLWGYEKNGEVIPQKLEVIQQGRVYWRKEFQPQGVEGLELHEYRDVTFTMPGFESFRAYGKTSELQKARDHAARMIQFGLPDRAYSDAQYGVEPLKQADGETPIDGPYVLLYATDYHPIWLAVEQLFYLYAAAVIAAVFLVYVVSGELSRYVTEPVEKLNHAALQMACGDRKVAYAVEKGRNDEIAELANSLNVMSRNLNAAMDRLQGEYDRQIEREKQRRELTSAIAHELKTPLGIIHSYCEGLQENIREEKRDHYLDVILDETENMDALVLQMLDLSKLESEAYRLQVEPLSLGELLCGEVERYRPAAERKRLRMETRTEPDCSITADRARIAQVVSNFLSNAVRHTPEGGAIQAAVSRVDGRIRLEVENEGAPIPEEQLGKIWNLFYKGDVSRERAKGGTGLGLAIARNILELHGLDYGVYNTKRGVCFWFAQKKPEK